MKQNISFEQNALILGFNCPIVNLWPGLGQNFMLGLLNFRIMAKFKNVLRGNLNKNVEIK